MFKKIIAIILMIALLIPLVACGDQIKQEQKEVTKEDSPTTTLESETKEAEETSDAAGEVSSENEGGRCFVTPQKTEYPQEEAPKIEVENITKEDLAKGYVVNYLMGVTYYLPTAWRELENTSIMIENLGDPLFDNDPIYSGKAYYYISPATATLIDEAKALEKQGKDASREWAKIAHERTPLFTLVMYRNDKLPVQLMTSEEDPGFPNREVIKAHPDLTLVIGQGEHNPDAVGELFMPEYQSLYESVFTIYNSLSTFPPETALETFQNRAIFDFVTKDLNGDEKTQKDITPAKRNLILFWDSRTFVSQKAYDELNAMQEDNKLDKVSVNSVLCNLKAEQTDEQEKAKILSQLGNYKVPVLLRDASMEDQLLRYVSALPLYVMVDDQGRVVDVHSGYMEPKAVETFVKNAE